MSEEDVVERPAAPSEWSPWPWLVLAVTITAIGIYIDPQLELDDDGQMNDLVVLGVHLAGFVMVLALFTNRRQTAFAEQADPLCTHCITPYQEGAHFCPRCGCPQTFFAATGQYERIYAQMWILGKAAHHPQRWTHVLFLTLLGITSLAPLTLVYFLPLMPGPDWVAGVLSWLIALAAAWAFGGLALLSWRNWIRRLRGEERRETEYGTPPWWTYDVESALPEPEAAEGQAE